MLIMATPNVIITKGKDWVLVDMSIMTNRGDHDIEFTVDDDNTGQPSVEKLGHILVPNEGVSVDVLPTGDVYVRSRYHDGLLAVSK